ncbi:MAG: hypothetical protein K9N62_02430 [Verrucomicrobia bacterium]|nr:hypothetical protein [Verrucomicrobiota bacterium]
MAEINQADSSAVLFQLLEEWRTLTTAESRAIELENWDALHELQSVKNELQASIVAAETTFFQNPALPDDAKEAERQRLKRTTAELMLLEKQNQTVLTTRIAETDLELKESNKTISSLKFIQQAYGKSGNSFWQAYS